MSTLIIPKHVESAGFFSCCSVILSNIIKSINNGIIPAELDCKDLFHLYKNNSLGDIRQNFFSINTDILYSSFTSITTNVDQFSDYSLINFSEITPIIKKYFTPSPIINRIIDNLISTYIINYDNTCVIRYRGTDKVLETVKPDYDEFINKAKLIKDKFPSIKFLILTDESEFLNKCIENIPDCIYFKELKTISSKLGRGIHNSCNASKDIYYFLASIYIASKCKYIVTTSGNCDIWISLFRGNANGILQHIHHKEYIYGIKHDKYTNTTIWYDNIPL